MASTILGISTLTQAQAVKAVIANLDTMGGITDSPNPEIHDYVDRVLLEVVGMDQTYVDHRGRVAVDAYVSVCVVLIRVDVEKFQRLDGKGQARYSSASTP